MADESPHASAPQLEEPTTSQPDPHGENSSGGPSISPSSSSLTSTAQEDGRPSVAGPTETAVEAEAEAAGGSSTSASMPAWAAAWVAGLRQQPLIAPLLAAWAWLLAQLQSLPQWVRAQRLRKLKEEADEDGGKDADRHAAYLAELNRGGAHAEAIAHVEAKVRRGGAG